jgi:hypothetical protein
MLSFVQRFRLMRSMVRVALRTDEGPDDPWQCTELDAPRQLLGSGSIHDFPWYFEGDSAVPVTSFGEVCSYLLGCAYAHDEDLFRIPDFWQHPVTFEQLRKGDCEDHALWAWRKLRELGYRAHLVTGSSDRDDADRGHAWVIFHGDGGLYLFETTAKGRERMVWPLDDVRGQYLPFFSVDETFRIFLYGGFGQYLLDRRGARKLPPPPGVLDFAAVNPGGER